MPYKPHELSQMVIRPDTEGMIIESYPFLEEIFEGLSFSLEGESFDIKSMTADSVLRYMAFVFDPHSPMIRQHGEIRVRKEKAGKETNIKPASVPSKVVVKFLTSVVASRDWAYIATLENNYEEYLDILNKTVNIDDENELIKTIDLKGKLRAQLREMRTEIPALYEEFFCNDEVLIKEHKVAATPEEIAKKMSGKK